MGLSIAQYGHAQFNSEIASFGEATGVRVQIRAARTEQVEQQPVEQEKVPEQRFRRLDRKPIALPSEEENSGAGAVTREGRSVEPVKNREETQVPVRAPERLKASSRTSSSTSELQFQVKTAEGDTVTLSVNAVQESSVDKVSYRSEDGSLKVAQRTQSSSLQANLSVEGELSEAELADITKALESLSQGKSIEDLGTLESASFEYNSRTILTQSRLSYVG